MLTLHFLPTGAVCKGKKQQIKKHKCRTHTVFSNNEEKLTEKLVLTAAVTKVQSLAFHVAYK